MVVQGLTTLSRNMKHHDIQASAPSPIQSGSRPEEGFPPSPSWLLRKRGQKEGPVRNSSNQTTVDGKYGHETREILTIFFLFELATESEEFSVHFKVMPVSG
jgi:hypothetical protein